jgi:DNA-binding transcriptional MerR regulator
VTDRSSLPLKLYYRIGEVASVVGVETHVLRYWESEFSTIRPQKSSKGHRVYSRKDVEKLIRVKELLYNEGYTVQGAKRKLQELIRAQAVHPAKPVPKPARTSDPTTVESGASVHATESDPAQRVERVDVLVSSSLPRVSDPRASERRPAPDGDTTSALLQMRAAILEELRALRTSSETRG